VSVGSRRRNSTVVQSEIVAVRDKEDKEDEEDGRPGAKTPAGR